MSICPNIGKACECQPQDGVMCPHGPTPDWEPWKPECQYPRCLAEGCNKECGTAHPPMDSEPTK